MCVCVCVYVAWFCIRGKKKQKKKRWNVHRPIRCKTILLKILSIPIKMCTWQIEDLCLSVIPDKQFKKRYDNLFFQNLGC